MEQAIIFPENRSMIKILIRPVEKFQCQRCAKVMSRERACNAHTYICAKDDKVVKFESIEDDGVIEVCQVCDRKFIDFSAVLTWLKHIFGVKNRFTV